MNRKGVSCYSLLLTAFLLLAALPQSSHALTVQRWLGQTVYVPVYSHIYADSRFKDKTLSAHSNPQYQEYRYGKPAHP